MGEVQSQKRKAPRGAGLWRGHNEAEQVVNLGFGGSVAMRILTTDSWRVLSLLFMLE